MQGQSKKVVFTILITLALNSQATTALPDLEIHVFEDESTSVDAVPGMQMVIYSADESIDQGTQVQGDNYQLLHTEDGEMVVHSENPSDNLVYPEDDIRYEFYIEGGYRQDKLDWNKAHPSGSPNVLSELTWDNIEIAVVELGATILTPSNFVMDGRFAYGTIFDGDNQDSDYYGDYKTQEFSRSNNNTDSGSTVDTSIGFGYRALIIPSSARFNKPTLSLTPKVGFSYHAQDFNISDGYQTIPAYGSFDDLDSDYAATWYGPWAGLDSELNIAEWYSLTTSFEYHYAFYEGTGDWNLRSDLEHPESFKHKAEGTGIVASIGSQFRLTPDLFLDLSVDYQNWSADKNGEDKMYFSNGSTAKMKFNEVNWESIGANIGLSYAF